MLQIGELVKGPFWPETVEIKNCELIDDDLFLVEAIGRVSNQYYAQYLENIQLGFVDHFSDTNEKYEDKLLYQHFLQYYFLESESRFSKSRARGNKNMIPLPHQIEAVYSRMLQSPQVRFLLADDPGAGKTIMSGMLIRELKARRAVDRTLILAPPLVVKQWQEELKEKFDEDFIIATRALLNQSVDMNPFEVNDQVIASMYWATRDDVKNMIVNAKFDLVIVDEAHKMAAYTVGQKRRVQRTKMYQLGETLLRHTEHCLLLTATPHKGDKENFKHLMGLVDHEIFSRITKGDSLYEKTNPYIIRRLKESMVNFDGTPLFPKRTTKTLGFELSNEEKELYEDVTDYVREHFNRAKQNNKPNVAFAMMLLQRRLSSSIEAIYLSLVRRKEKLQEILVSGIKQSGFNQDDFEVSILEEQEAYEIEAEGETEIQDFAVLQLEIDILDKLIRKAGYIRNSENERKYLELERSLFGAGGLLSRGEKILIFTESKDTLLYLERRLKTRVAHIAKIVGHYSMDQRRAEVEKFRNEVQVMLATDAGGESINLQFCNQMINYDIPWNPNRLEQRMGRIHRIGQKNEVFVFNLVAVNTREGEVLTRLLRKMEQMREDLGQEQVYDFIGDVLEEQSADLASIMEEAVAGRQNLDEIIERMEKSITQEHQKLLELAAKERLDQSSFDLPGAKRLLDELFIKSLPIRTYGKFVLEALAKTRTRISISQDETLIRIDRFPKNIRDFARKNKIVLPTLESIRFTLNEKKESDTTPMLHADHPLFKLTLEISERKLQQMVIPSFEAKLPIQEDVNVELNRVTIVDGTGRILEQQLILIGKTNNGTWFEISPYFLFSTNMEITKVDIEIDPTFRSEIIKRARKILRGIMREREEYTNRRNVFLRNSFNEQMNTLNERLERYRAENYDGKNTALINQTFAQIEELEEKSQERLEETEREKMILLKPVNNLAQFRLVPSGLQNGRVIPALYYNLIESFELNEGRIHITEQPAFGIADFISEEPNGETRFIILTPDIDQLIEDLILEDYKPIWKSLYFYEVKNDKIKVQKAGR
ncbi:helicase-related protein [Neobacillus niacini]|uniref:DEAD/DEAH box helicase n=1 Tax=Neobacillus niacini TaxID=86668 RepID=UPI002FFF1748